MTCIPGVVANQDVPAVFEFSRSRWGQPCSPVSKWENQLMFIFPFHYRKKTSLTLSRTVVVPRYISFRKTVAGEKKFGILCTNPQLVHKKKKKRPSPSL